MAFVNKKPVDKSPFKQKHDEQTQDEICNNWMQDMLTIFNNPQQSGYLNMRDAQEYLLGIYDLGHADGTHQAAGQNLITLIPDNHE